MKSELSHPLEGSQRCNPARETRTFNFMAAREIIFFWAETAA